MVPLIVQLVVFLLLVTLGRLRRFQKSAYIERKGAVSLGVLFVFTGIAHFTMTAEMASMFFEWVPYKTVLVWFSGGFEVAAGIALLAEARYEKPVGMLLIIFLILAFPLNIHAALTDAKIGGGGPSYLLLRAPLQLFWITWTWYYTVRRKKNALTTNVS